MVPLALITFFAITQLVLPVYGGNVLCGESAGNGSKVASNKVDRKLNILVVAPGLYFNISHRNFALSVAKVLAEKHNVHLVITCRNADECRINESHSNLTINYYFPEDKDVLALFRAADAEPSEKTDRNICFNFWKVFREMINNRSQISYLNENEFDVGIAEMSVINQYSFALFHSLGIKKTVTIKAFSIGPQQYHDLTDVDNVTNLKLMDKLRNADPPVPVVNKTQLGDRNDEQRRARKETIQKDYDDDVAGTHNGVAKMDLEFKAIMKDFPGIIQMFRETRFLWINSQSLIEFDDGKVFEGVKKVGMIGGITLKNPPGDIDQVKDESGKPPGEKQTPIADKMKKIGRKVKVVLISFGTNRITKVNNNQFLAIRTAIADFAREKKDYLFVWQLTEGDTRIDDLNAAQDLPNIHAADWVNIQALLASKKVVAFISHCGRNSQIESVYYSVPLICIPMFNDANYNAETMARKQMTIVLNKDKSSGSDNDSFTTAGIKNALLHGLGTTINMKIVKKVGKELTDQIKNNGPKKVILDHMDEI